MIGCLNDGHVLSPDCIVQPSAKSTTRYKNTKFKIGRVIEKFHKEDKNNLGKESTEYTVVIEGGTDCGQMLRNVVKTDPLGGTDNYAEITLQEKTEGNTDGDSTPPEKTNASKVLLASVDGFYNKWVIVNGMPTSKRHGIPKSEGVANKMHFNGVDITLDKDGTTKIDKSGTSITIDKDGNITMNTKDKMTINSTGDTELNSSGNTAVNSTGTIDMSSTNGMSLVGPSVALGATGASQSVVRGDAMATLFNSHTHGGPVPDQTMGGGELQTKIKVE